MKKAILTGTLLIMLIPGLILAGCTKVMISKEVGPTVTRIYDITDFSRIEIGHAFKFEVTPADTYSIQIQAGESIFDHIEVTKSGDKLKIDMDSLFFHSYRSPRAKITMPELKGLHLSGASEGNVSGFSSSHDFESKVSGASELDMDMETGAFVCEMSGASEVSGYLRATSCDIDLSGASQIDLSGSGGNIRLEASGASEADLSDFTVNDADIKFSGASDGSLDINGRLDVDFSGASSLEYSGNPTLGDIDLSGESDLKRK